MVSIKAETPPTHAIAPVVHDVAPADLVAAGDRLGFYRALDMLGSLTADELAEFTGVEERFVHDWLHHEVEAGHLNYLPNAKRFVLSQQQAEAISSYGVCLRTRSGKPNCA